MTRRRRNARPPAVVLGAGINGLGQVRGVVRVAPRAFCLAPRYNCYHVAASRHATWVESPDPVTDPEAAVRAALDFGRRQGGKPVLLFANDEWLVASSLQEKTVRETYLVPQSSWSLLGQVLNKATLYPLATECGVPVPQTWRFSCLAGLLAGVGELRFPCIMKPEIGIGFVSNLPEELRRQALHRTTLLDSPEVLSRWAHAMLRGGLDMPMLVQEYVPGGADKLYTLTSYSNAQGKLVAGSVGHKVRQFPPGAGSIAAGRLDHRMDVFDQGKRLLERIGYHGLANTEFKYDVRDGSYKLMEINPRLGVWNCSALAAGMNLAGIAYLDMLGETYEGPAFKTESDGRLWVDLLGDATNCLWRYRAKGFPEAHMGLRAWARSIRGKRIGAVWRWADPMPGVLHFLHLAGAVVRHIFRKRRGEGSP